MRGRAAVLVLVAAALLFCTHGGRRVHGVSAHAALERSLPADGARLATPPAQVELFFAEQLVQNHAGTFAVVYSDAGAQVSGDERVDPQDGRHLLVPLRGALDAGSYVVFWKTTSDEDGGVTLGSFRFSIGAAAGTSTPPGPGSGQVLVPDDQQRRALTLVTHQGGGGGAGPVSIAVAIAGGLLAGSALTYLVMQVRARRAPPASAPVSRGRRR